MIITTLLLILLVGAALWSVLRGSLIRAVIALAAVSVILSVLMYRLDAPLAAVFELSVCAGLITVVFMSTISLTKPLSQEELIKTLKERGRYRRFRYLPVIVAAAAILLAYFAVPPAFTPPPPAEAGADVRTILWNSRQLDLLGQVLVLLTGVFAVVVFFKGRSKRDKKTDLI